MISPIIILEILLYVKITKIQNRISKVVGDILFRELNKLPKMEPPKPDYSKAFKDIDKVLKVGGRIVKYDITPLTAFGENFGSIMLKVDFTIENSKNQRTIHTVAKLIPQIPVLQKIFKIQVTYKCEMNFYNKIVPILQDFQNENDVSMIADYFPKFYGGRISLNPHTDVVDNAAIMLMENLKLNGFENEDRHVGFDLNTAKLVLDHLTNLQAAVTALRIKNPEVYEEKVKPYFTGWGLRTSLDPQDKLDDDFFKDLELNLEIAKLRPAIEKSFQKHKEIDKGTRKVSEVWGSIVHNDFWVNNIMVKHTNDSTELKFLDFQSYDYDSCVKDLLFFLITSVQKSVLKYHFNKLLKYYYDQFVKNLKEFKVDVTDFTYKSFENELEENAASEIFHGIFFLRFVVMGPKFDKDAAPPPPPPPPKEGEDLKPPQIKSTHQSRERVWTVLEEAAKKKWI